MEVNISMGAQKNFEAAIKKYGEVFAEAVVEKELQLHTDNLDCFDEYAQYDWMKEFIQVNP